LSKQVDQGYKNYGSMLDELCDSFLLGFDTLLEMDGNKFDTLLEIDGNKFDTLLEMDGNRFDTLLEMDGNKFDTLLEMDGNKFPQTASCVTCVSSE
jgi:hypothetical protein